MPDIGVPDFSGLMRAEVMINTDPLGEGRIGVMIKKIMSDENHGDDPKDSKSSKESINKKAIDDSGENTFDSKISNSNYLWARPVFFLNSSDKERSVSNAIPPVKGDPNEASTHPKITLGEELKQTKYVPTTGSYDIPRVGTIVWVIFEDDDPQKLYWLPFGPSLDGQVTPMDEVEQKINKNLPKNKSNITVLREWHNGTVLYYDTNDNRNVFTLKFQNGHRFKIEFNAVASGIVMNTEKGHIIELIDKSSVLTALDNPMNINIEDGIPFGSFIRLQTNKGNKILLDDNAGMEKIDVITQGGHKINMDDNSKTITTTDINGNTIVMNPTGIFLN
ncbi:MAG TPA: hypothetical protein P5513_06725 [Candidatus Diapherotrites archaeon]|nr:hypothetical protein [Candidatus Diapherotrites archaeon]